MKWSLSLGRFAGIPISVHSARVLGLAGNARRHHARLTERRVRSDSKHDVRVTVRSFKEGMTI
jgi:hypothetical protein